MNTTYDVRIQGIRTYKGKRGTTYSVCWTVAARPFQNTFATKALAESYRSKLIVAQREGVAFDVASGLPEPLARKLNSRSWLKHAIAFVDMKWPHSSPKHRVSIAEALSTVTPVFLTSERGAPDEKAMRARRFTDGRSTRSGAIPVSCRRRRPEYSNGLRRIRAASAT